MGSFLDFVRDHVPAGRVLEIGCGDGALARELDAAGYEVVAIDPVAPEGAIFRRVTLAELDEPGPFDAAVAAFSLHHVHALDAALDRVVELLAPGGVVCVDEFAPERLDEVTADWYYGQLRALGAARRSGVPASLDALRAEWAAEHEGLHGYDRIRPALDARFSERAFSWGPHLHRYLDAVAGDALERALIDAGAIRALGYRYAGAPR